MSRTEEFSVDASFVPAWFPILFVLLLFSAVLELTRTPNRVDRLISDQLLHGADYKFDERIVLVAIDERSLEKLGRWPWRRTVHAELLRQLSKAGVSGVAFDILFTEPSQQIGDDEQFALAMRQYGPVVLAAFADASTSSRRMVMPTPVLAAAAARVGHAHVEIDPDGIVRSVFLNEKIGHTVWSSLSVALIEAVSKPAERMISVLNTNVENRHQTTFVDERYVASSDRLVIPFARALGASAKLSFIDVLEGKVPVDSLKGKLVLIGLDSAGLGDAYPTPVSGSGPLMSGVEIHANILSALLSNGGLREGTAYENLILSGCVVGLSIICLISFRARLVPMALSLVLVSVVFAVFMCQRQLGVQVAPSVALLMLALVYPVWTWQRLSAAVEYLAEETRRIRGSDGFLVGPEFSVDSDELGRNIANLRVGVHAFRELRSLIEGALNGLSDAVFVSNQEGMIVLANEVGGALCQRVGIPIARHSLLLAVLRGICPGINHFQSVESLANRCLSNDATDVEFIAFDGRSFLIKFTRWQSSIYPFGWVVSLLDITSVRRAERERDEAMKFITHDIRAPQASIIALLDLNRIRPGGGKGTGDLFEKIEFHARRTLALADEFASLDRVGVACSSNITGGHVNAWQVLEAAANNVWELATSRGMAVVMIGNALEKLTVCGNFSMLERAVTNLIENSVKYGYEKSRIVCELSVEDVWVVISVSDHGRGLSREDQGRIFEKFVRVNDDRGSSPTGLGLGLAYVKAVVERHGGRVRLESALGFGSRFEMLLPLAQAYSG